MGVHCQRRADRIGFPAAHGRTTATDHRRPMTDDYMGHGAFLTDAGDRRLAAFAPASRALSRPLVWPTHTGRSARDRCGVSACGRPLAALRLQITKTRPSPSGTSSVTSAGCSIIRFIARNSPKISSASCHAFHSLTEMERAGFQPRQQRCAPLTRPSDTLSPEHGERAGERAWLRLVRGPEESV